MTGDWSIKINFPNETEGVPLRVFTKLANANAMDKSRTSNSSSHLGLTNVGRSGGKIISSSYYVGYNEDSYRSTCIGHTFNQLFFGISSIDTIGNNSNRNPHVYNKQLAFIEMAAKEI